MHGLEELFHELAGQHDAEGGGRTVLALLRFESDTVWSGVDYVCLRCQHGCVPTVL